MSFKIYWLGTFFLLIALLGCKRKGCTDSTALNYDEKAKRDDASCEYPVPEEPQLIVKFHFDATQARLDNFGQPATIPPGNAAQSPVFHQISAHYVELAPTAWTQLGQGEIIYQGAETTAGGSDAVDFSQAKLCTEGETFFTIPLKDITPATYEWLRVSLTYQNYEVEYRANGFDLIGRLASFVGFNTYIEDYTIENQTVLLNANQLQGYWGFESLGQIITDNAPQTTVPNPISSTSPVPPGSCVVTGDFNTPFTITGNESSDLELIISVSTNNSFEWIDVAQNNIFEPLDGDTVVDMGLRGVKPIVTVP